MIYFFANQEELFLKLILLHKEAHSIVKTSLDKMDIEHLLRDLAKYKTVAQSRIMGSLGKLYCQHFKVERVAQSALETREAYCECTRK